MTSIGVVSTGDMGHAVARTLRDGGHDVFTSLAGRSARTAALAAEAGIADAGTLTDVVARADILLSIMSPAAAESFARDTADAVRASGRAPLFVDCNAIAPGTSRDIGAIVRQAGSDYVDGGIIGAPPGRRTPTRLYVSGDRAEELAAFARPDMRIVPLGTDIGAASGLKMCYAALTKGTMTLDTLVLMGAARLGLAGDLRAEMIESQPVALERMERMVPWLAADAERWVGEMHEIAKTFAETDLTPRMHEGAAEMFELLAASPLAAETRQTADRSRTLDAAIEAFLTVLSSPDRDAAD
jgi:3-hydroxyisobutyrate dehydrogenase-like beta-hydroxyacid dehydrogenase